MRWIDKYLGIIIFIWWNLTGMTFGIIIGYVLWGQ